MSSSAPGQMEGSGVARHAIRRAREVSDLAEVVLQHAEGLDRVFDSDSDAESGPPTPSVIFTDADAAQARAECRQLGLTGASEDYYIEWVAMRLRALVFRREQIAKRERRIARRGPIDDSDSDSEFEDEFPPPLQSETEEEFRLVRERAGVPRELVDRELVVFRLSHELDLKEYEVTRQEYAYVRSQGDPAFFLREYDKVLSDKRKLEKKISTALELRRQAEIALIEVPLVQHKLQNVEAEIRDLENMVSYGNKRVADLETELSVKGRRVASANTKIQFYEDRESEFKDILRNTESELYTEILKLETRLYPLEEDEAKKIKYIRTLERKLKKKAETINELTEYAYEAERNLERVKEAEQESKKNATFYNTLYNSSNSAANHWQNEAEDARKRAKKQAEEKALFVDERYEKAKQEIENLGDQLEQTLEAFKGAEKEIAKAKAELRAKEEELVRVHKELDMVYATDRRLSVSTTESGSPLATSSLQSELNMAEEGEYSEHDLIPMLPSVNSEPGSPSNSVSALKSRMADLEAELQAKIAEVEDHKAKLEAKEFEADDACNQLKAKTAELNNLIETVDELTKTTQEVRDGAEEGRKDFAARAAKYEEDYAKLYELHEKLKTDCIEGVHKISKLQALQHEKSVKIQEQLAAAQVAAIAENNAKAKQLAELSAELAKSKADNEAKLQDLQKEYNALNDEREKVATANQANTEKVNKLKANLAQTEANAAATLKSFQNNYDALKNEKIKANDANEDKAQQIAGLEKQLTQAKEDFAKKFKTLQGEYNKSKADDEAKLQGLQEKYNALSNEKEKVAIANKANTEKVNKLKANLAQTEANATAALNSFQDNYDALKNENNKANDANEDKAQQIAGLEKQFTQAQEDSAQKLESLQGECNALKDERDRVIAEFGSSTQKIDSLQDERDKLAKELETARKENIMLKLAQLDDIDAPEKLRDMGLQLAKTERSLSEVKMTIAAKEQDIVILNANFNTQKTAIKVLEDQIETAKNAAVDMESKNTDLNEQLKALKSDAAKTSLKIAHLEDQLEHAENKAAEMDAEVAELKAQLESSKDRNSEMKSKTAELEEQVESAREMSRAKEEHLKDELAELQGQLDHQAGSLEHQTAQVKLLTKQKEEVVKALTSAAAHFDNFREKLQDSNKKSRASKELVNALQADLEAMQAKHDREMAEIGQEVARLAENQVGPDDELFMLVESMEAGFDYINQAINEASESIAAKDGQIKQLEADLDKAKDMATQTQLRLDAMEAELENLRDFRVESEIANVGISSQIAELHARLMQLIQKLKDLQDSAEQTVENLNIQLAEHQSFLAEFEKELGDLRDQVHEISEKLMAERLKSANLEKGRAEDREVSLAQEQLLTSKIEELQHQVKRQADNIENLEVENKQIARKSQRISEMERILADMNKRHADDSKASLAATEKLQEKAAQTENMNKQLLDSLMKLTDQAGKWEVRERDLKDLVQSQAETIVALKDEGIVVKSKFNSVAKRAIHDIEIINNLRDQASILSKTLMTAVRDNEALRRRQKDMDQKPRADSLCHTCGRACQCPITVSAATGFFGQWWNVIRALWHFTCMMPANTKAALLYLLGVIMLPVQCLKPLASRAKIWCRSQVPNGVWPWMIPPVIQHEDGQRATSDYDWPSVPTVPHVSMVYSIICWTVILFILGSSLSYWSTSEERRLWLRANMDTRAYFNFARREGAPGACLVPQPLPIDLRFVYEPSYGNFCGFVEKQTGVFALYEVVR